MKFSSLISIIFVCGILFASTHSAADSKITVAPAAAGTLDAEVLSLVKTATEPTPTSTSGATQSSTDSKIGDIKIPDGKDAVKASAMASIAEESLPVFKAIAVKTDKADKKTSVWIWLRMLGSLAVVLTMFIGGVYGFKKMPMANKMGQKAKMIHVLGQHHLGAKKSLAVVRVAGETVLIGITDNNISILKTLSLLDDDLPGETVSKKSNFASTLKNQVNRETLRGDAADDLTEEFSMQGIKDIVSKRIKDLKGSRQ